MAPSCFEYCLTFLVPQTGTGIFCTFPFLGPKSKCTFPGRPVYLENLLQWPRQPLLPEEGLGGDTLTSAVPERREDFSLQKVLMGQNRGAKCPRGCLCKSGWRRLTPVWASPCIFGFYESWQHFQTASSLEVCPRFSNTIRSPGCPPSPWKAVWLP